VTVQFHNELEFLHGWFCSAYSYADEIICGSHSPTDGSLEFVKTLQSISKVPIHIVEFPEETVYEHGFSYIKNALIEKATGDWIVCLDADEEMNIEKELFASYIRNAKGLSTQTMHIAETQPHWSLNDRKVVRQEANWEVQRHWRIFKNGCGIKWTGLIHESLRVNEGMHVSLVSKPSDIKMYHFGALANPSKRTFKDGLYAELLLRAEENVSLRMGTDKWWFDNFIPENRAKLENDRSEYRNAKNIK